MRLGLGLGKCWDETRGTYMFYIDLVCKRHNNSIFFLGEALVLVWGWLGEKNEDDFGRMHDWYGQKN